MEVTSSVICHQAHDSNDTLNASKHTTTDSQPVIPEWEHSMLQHSRVVKDTYLQTLLYDVQQDEQTEEIHAPHGYRPQEIRPEETVLCSYCVVVAT